MMGVIEETNVDKSLETVESLQQKLLQKENDLIEMTKTFQEFQESTEILTVEMEKQTNEDQKIIVDLRKQLTTLQEAKEQLEIKNSILIDQNDTYKKQLDDLHEKNIASVQKINEFEINLAKLTESLKNSRLMNEELSNSNDLLNEKLNLKVTENLSLNTTLDRQNKELIDLRARILNIQSAETLDSSEITIEADMKNTLEELEKMLGTITTIRSKMQDCERVCTDFVATVGSNSQQQIYSTSEKETENPDEGKVEEEIEFNSVEQTSADVN
eukprot:TRINITY_DN3090_c0_g1_i2.p1 TRINITY_DN3090_c0_g1~~TRINITY_DN3090_c0_g1_i2.p1  ORF type:complete len:272 (+),score=104.72 TRINITY_DN3090_c0_g1_i2:1037-1852(+)